MYDKKPSIICVRISTYDHSVPVVNIIHPDISYGGREEEGSWWLRDILGEHLYKISYIDVFHKEGYRVYHMDRIDQYNKLWYWRLKEE